MRAFLISGGLALACIGLVWPLFGHLPGDVRFGRGHTEFFIPLGSCVLVSVVFSGFLILFFWLWER